MATETVYRYPITPAEYVPCIRIDKDGTVDIHLHQNSICFMFKKTKRFLIKESAEFTIEGYTDKQMIVNSVHVLQRLASVPFPVHATLMSGRWSEYIATLENVPLSAADSERLDTFYAAKEVSRRRDDIYPTLILPDCLQANARAMLPSKRTQEAKVDQKPAKHAKHAIVATKSSQQPARNQRAAWDHYAVKSTRPPPPIAMCNCSPPRSTRSSRTTIL